MPTRTLDSAFAEFLRGRRIATLATENPDGSAHLTAVWYVFEAGVLFVGTSSRTRKARNLQERPRASLMVDLRKAGSEKGVTASGKVELITGNAAQKLNHGIHSRYLSAVAMSDPQIGPVFAAFDDITIKLTPDSWFSWDMAIIDAQAFGGKLCTTPGYLLPLE